MFLAHQAQSRRDILAEQYAQNRKTKREAKMKYGRVQLHGSKLNIGFC